MDSFAKFRSAIPTSVEIIGVLVIPHSTISPEVLPQLLMKQYKDLINYKFINLK